MNPQHWRLLVGLIAMTAFVVAALVAPALFSRPPTDFVLGYHPAALGLQQGQGYVGLDGRFMQDFPPGYSVLIAPFVEEDVERSLGLLRIVHGFLAVILVVLLALLIRRLLPQQWQIPILAVGILWPPQLALSYPGGSEILFAVFVVAAVIVAQPMLRAPPPKLLAMMGFALALGSLLGLATLTRTMGLAVGGAVLIAVAVGASELPVARRMLVIVMVATSLSATALPWILTYQRHTGYVGITNADVGVRSLRFGFQRFEDWAPGRVLEQRRHTWDDLPQATRDIAEVGRKWPFQTAGLLTAKAFRAWYGAASGRFDALVLPMNLPWALLFVLASFRALARWKDTPAGIILLHGIVAACWVSTFVTSSVFRYMAPVFPIAVVAIAWHAEDVLRKARAKMEA
jgi:hypothetical protein